MIKYVDVDNNNKEVKSQSVSGKTDQTVDTKYEVPANYELVAGQRLPKAVTFKANGQLIIVKVKHKKVSVEVGVERYTKCCNSKDHGSIGQMVRPKMPLKQLPLLVPVLGLKKQVRLLGNAWSPAQKLAAYRALEVDGYSGSISQ